MVGAGGEHHSSGHWRATAVALEQRLRYCPPVLSVGDVVDATFELRERLARGGMSVVWRAYHRGLRRDVALKLTPVQDAVRVERLLREANRLSRVRAPSLVEVLHAGHDPVHGVAFLVMPLLLGETLAERLRSEGPLSRDELVAMLLDVAAALEALHEVGIVHRDVSAGNVLLKKSEAGRVLGATLIDLGISWEATSAPVTTTGHIPGTWGYIAPELAREGAKPTPRSDQYALAVLAYEAAEGARPFAGELPEVVFARQASQTPKPCHACGKPVGAAIERAMERDPELRFDSVLDFASAAAGLRRTVDLQYVWRSYREVAKTLGALGGLLGAVLLFIWIVSSLEGVPTKAVSTSALDGGAPARVDGGPPQGR